MYVPSVPLLCCCCTVVVIVNNLHAWVPVIVFHPYPLVAEVKGRVNFSIQLDVRTFVVHQLG